VKTIFGQIITRNLGGTGPEPEIVESCLQHASKLAASLGTLEREGVRSQSFLANEMGGFNNEFRKHRGGGIPS